MIKRIYASQRQIMKVNNRREQKRARILWSMQRRKNITRMFEFICLKLELRCGKC